MWTIFTMPSKSSNRLRHNICEYYAKPTLWTLSVMVNLSITHWIMNRWKGPPVQWPDSYIQMKFIDCQELPFDPRFLSLCTNEYDRSVKYQDMVAVWTNTVIIPSGIIRRDRMKMISALPISFLMLTYPARSIYDRGVIPQFYWGAKQHGSRTPVLLCYWLFDLSWSSIRFFNSGFCW